MSPALEINTQAVGRAVLVTVVGEVDNATAPQLRTAIGGALRGTDARDQGEVLAIDLTRVEFLSSGGLSVLVEATREARKRDRPLRVVVGDHHPVIRRIQLTGLDRYLTLCYSVADALGRQL